MGIRVGVIGAGNIGAAHASTLARTVSGAMVSAIYDLDSDRAERVAGEVGARVAPTVEGLIASTDVDAVLIASPDAIHAEQVHLAIAVGKPMLCEKPLAVDVADAERVLNAEVEFGRRLIQVGFMRRFDPGYLRLRAELTPDGIGEPLIVHHVHHNTSAPYGLRTEQTLTNMVTHEFDISRWLIGEEFTSVMVLAGKDGPLTPMGERDPIMVILQSESGILVEVEAYCNAQYGYAVHCRITGSRGQSAMGDGAWVTRSTEFIRGTEVPELWLGRFAEAYRVQLQAWIDSLSGRGPLMGASAWDGYAAAVISSQAIEAHRTGDRIAIELSERPALYC